MKLLLDENLPKRLKADFADHEISTVRERGWNGIKNGQLLQLMVENGFEALLTFTRISSINRTSASIPSVFLCLRQQTILTGN
jgi:hypothetical protein